MPDFEPNLGLFLQEANRSDRLLILARLASQRSSEGWFKSAQIVELNRDLRLPAVGNVSAFLGAARDKHKLVLSRGGGHNVSWALTPVGEKRAADLVTDGGTALSAYVDASNTAPFAMTEYPTLPPELAPYDLLPKLRPFLAEYPFETNVFLMTRFPTKVEADPIADVIDALREAVSDHGLTLHVAFDRAIHDELWPNIAAHMWACRYGLGLLETSLAHTVQADDHLDPATLKAITLNDNVLLELGSMLTLGRRCKILKDINAPQPPSDLTSQIYREVDLGKLASVKTAASEWITEDLLIRST